MTTTIKDVRRAAKILADHFPVMGCYGEFPLISVTEIGADVALTARRHSESYPSPAAALKALPGWCERFNRDEEDGTAVLREAGLL